MIYHPQLATRILKFTNGVNPFVKAFIISDALIYSSLNFVTPLFALFVTKDISGGSIEVATSAITLSFITRIITELVTSRNIGKLSERSKIVWILVATLAVSLSYYGFAVAGSRTHLFALWSLIGVAWGISTPAKLSLFSTHLDKGKETVEWGITDVTNMLLVGSATALGGFIAAHYGFTPLFYAAVIINSVGALPYFFYLKISPHKSKNA